MWLPISMRVCIMFSYSIRFELFVSVRVQINFNIWTRIKAF